VKKKTRLNENKVAVRRGGMKIPESSGEGTRKVKKGRTTAGKTPKKKRMGASPKEKLVHAKKKKACETSGTEKEKAGKGPSTQGGWVKKGNLSFEPKGESLAHKQSRKSGKPLYRKGKKCWTRIFQNPKGD